EANPDHFEGAQHEVSHRFDTRRFTADDYRGVPRHRVGQSGRSRTDATDTVAEHQLHGPGVRPNELRSRTGHIQLLREGVGSRLVRHDIERDVAAGHELRV